MTFLNPTILFGLLAASIPIVLHFLNLKKLKKVEFSTLIFLKELQKSQIRKIKLKQWILLLLRILIISSLVFAFARPTIKNDWLGSSSAKTTAVFVIDNTISMSITGDRGSYLNQSKQLAKELLKSFNNGDEIAVLPYIHEDNFIVKPSSDFRNVLKEIDNIQISHTRRNLNESLIKAGRILFESNNYNKEVYLFTDLQLNSFYYNEGQLSRLTELFRGAKFFYFDLNKKSPINIGIDSIKLNTQIFEKNKQINFSASVKNYSESNRLSSIVSLFINDKRSAQQNIVFNSKETKEIYFETTLQDTGLVNAFVELEDDDMIFDNKRFTTFYVPDKINILTLYDTYEDLQFVRLILNNKLINNFQITELNVLQLPSQNLKNYDAIVLAAIPRDNDIVQLNNFINSGGGLLFFPPSNVNVSSVQIFFNSLGLPKPEMAVGKKNSFDFSTQFEKIDFMHPIFSNLFEDKSKTKLDSPEIYYYLKFYSGIKGKDIISLFDKSSFLSEYKIGFGKALIFNTSPVLSWSNFPLKSIFPALLSKSVLYLSSKNKEEGSILCGDEVYISKPASKQLKVLYPNNNVELINLDSLRTQNYVRFTKTNSTGTYRFYSGNKLIDYRSINHDPKESIIEYHSFADLRNYLEKVGIEEELIRLDDNQNFSKQIYSSRFGTELWKYFIIAALIFALIEMFVSKSSRKDLESNKN